MAKLVSAKCPNCGAALNVDTAAASISCDYCGQHVAVQRKTIFGQKAPPPALATPVIHVANPSAIGVLVGVVAFTVLIGAIVTVVMCQVRSAVNRTTATTKSVTVTSSSGQTVTIKSGRDPFDNQALGKAMDKMSQAMSMLSPLTTPQLARGKFLGHLRGQVTAIKLILRDSDAALDVLGANGEVARYWYRSGRVDRDHVTPADGDKNHPFELLRMSVSPVKRIKADALRRAGGRVDRIEYGHTNATKGHGWKVVCDGGSKTALYYDRRGKFVSSQ